MNIKVALKFFFSLIRSTSGPSKIIFVILSANVLAALLEGLSFSFILFALMAFDVPSKIQEYPFFPSWLSPFSTFQLFSLFLGTAVFLQVMRSGLYYMGQVGMIRVGGRLQTGLMEKIYDQVFHFSYRYASQYRTGDLVDYASIPIQVTLWVAEAFNRAIVNFLLIVVSLLLMFFLSPPLTFFNVILFASAALAQKFLMKKVSSASDKYASGLSEMNQAAVQYLHGLKAVHLASRQKEVLNHVRALGTQISKNTRMLHLWHQLVVPFNESIGIILVGISLLVGSWWLEGDPISILPLLLTFLTLTYRLSTRLQVFMSSLSLISCHSGQLKRLEEILSSNGKEYIQDEGQKEASFCTAIDFDNVSFSHQAQALEALNGISFSLKKGTFTALVGQSGAGKTTVIELLARLYDPLNGGIKVDGCDIREFALNQWRKKLGIVTQDHLLFNQSVEDNIRFGYTEADEKAIIEAARSAGMHERIMKMPAGYQTLVGEQGYRLSGGEKQRIALARALVRDPEILILDEATSQLDSETEQLIQETLQLFKGKKTLVLVAHRLSTIINADQILVLEKGKIVERGTHQDLLKSQGRYQLFWNLQTNGAL